MENNFAKTTAYKMMNLIRDLFQTAFDKVFSAEFGENWFDEFKNDAAVQAQESGYAEIGAYASSVKGFDFQAVMKVINFMPKYRASLLKYNGIENKESVIKDIVFELISYRNSSAAHSNNADLPSFVVTDENAIERMKTLAGYFNRVQNENGEYYKDLIEQLYYTYKNEKNKRFYPFDEVFDTQSYSSEKLFSTALALKIPVEIINGKSGFYASDLERAKELIINTLSINGNSVSEKDSKISKISEYIKNHRTAVSVLCLVLIISIIAGAVSLVNGDKQNKKEPTAESTSQLDGHETESEEEEDSCLGVASLWPTGTTMHPQDGNSILGFVEERLNEEFQEDNTYSCCSLVISSFDDNGSMNNYIFKCPYCQKDACVLNEFCYKRRDGFTCKAKCASCSNTVVVNAVSDEEYQKYKDYPCTVQCPNCDETLPADEKLLHNPQAEWTCPFCEIDNYYGEYDIIVYLNESKIEFNKYLYNDVTSTFEKINSKNNSESGTDADVSEEEVYAYTVSTGVVARADYIVNKDNDINIEAVGYYIYICDYKGYEIQEFSGYDEIDGFCVKPNHSLISSISALYDGKELDDFREGDLASSALSYYNVTDNSKKPLLELDFNENVFWGSLRKSNEKAVDKYVGIKTFESILNDEEIGGDLLLNNGVDEDWKFGQRLKAVVSVYKIDEDYYDDYYKDEYIVYSADDLNGNEIYKDEYEINIDDIPGHNKSVVSSFEIPKSEWKHNYAKDPYYVLRVTVEPIE